MHKVGQTVVVSPYFKKQIGLFNKDISCDHDKLQTSRPIPLLKDPDSWVWEEIGRKGREPHSPPCASIMTDMNPHLTRLDNFNSDLIELKGNKVILYISYI